MKQIEVVCAVIQNEAGKLLIAKRSSRVADGMWEFPGGKVEPNETKEEACVREIQEELALHIVVDGFVTDVYDCAFDPVIHVSAYRAHIVEGVMELHAHKEVAWVMPEELYAYEFQAADRKLLNQLQTKADQSSHTSN